MTNYSYIVNVNKKNMAKAFSDKEKQQVIATLKRDAEQCMIGMVCEKPLLMSWFSV